MDDSNVSIKDTKEREWKTPMYPVESPKIKVGGLQCFQCRHQRERMEESNVYIEDTNKKC